MTSSGSGRWQEATSPSQSCSSSRSFAMPGTSIGTARPHGCTSRSSRASSRWASSAGSATGRSERGEGRRPDGRNRGRKQSQQPEGRNQHTPGVRRAVSLGLVLVMMAGAIVTLAPAPPVAAAGQIEVYKTGLDFPIALALSSDGRIFFAEKTTGSIRIIYRANRTLLPTSFITLPNTDGAGERGLLGLALDPGFPSTPYVYAYQTYNDVTNGTTYNRIVRIRASGNVGVSYTVILRLPPLSAAIHNGGVIGFGPDGKLYAVVGENGNQSRSQDPLSPMGKVLRMESNGSAPPDNPFYNNPSWYNLTYTYGHRNMFGLAFHPMTGRVYVTENGPTCNDEINLLPNLASPDRNFGWGPTASCGSLPPPADTNRDGPNPLFPIWWWGTTICPTNAAIYRGPYFPTWQGDLFMGDCNTGRFHRLHLVPPNYDSVASDDILWTAPASIIAVAIGPDGAFWLTTPSTIYRYWDSGQPPIASLTATPNPAIVGSPVAFDASGSSDPDGNIVSDAWNFGDSTGGSGVNVVHTYLTFGTFNATLTITDNESFTATAYRHIVVRAPPIASFTANPNPAVVGASVTFDASASRDPDGNVVAYAWDFGDSTTGSGAITTHPYTIPGTFNVTLNVTDNDSLNGTVSHDGVVQAAPPGPQPPVADFLADPVRVNPGVPVTFD
ncbi:MAG: PKD domain-containing protein, partial [Methanobacteriota archaeon]